MTIKDFKRIRLPDAPGVYFFRGSRGEILYIGKATSIRERVRSYFTDDVKNTRGMKIFTMLTLARRISFKKTDSVLEALILENNLIKKYQPPYNTREKDDKSYNVVIITREKFPRVLLERSKNLSSWPQKNLKYVFGPFPNGSALKEALALIRKIFPFRDKCIPQPFGIVGKPCFNAQVGLCPGVCYGAVNGSEYAHTIRNIKNFFGGNKKKILTDLEQEMKKKAGREEFEKANEIKRTLFALKHIEDVALIKDTSRERVDGVRIEAFDIAHLSGAERVGVVVTIINGHPKKDLYRTFKIKEDKNDDTGGLKELIYRRFKHQEWGLPAVIVLDGGVQQINAARLVLGEVPNAPTIVSVVKNEHHKPKNIIGEKVIVDNYKRSIYLANAEAHRFAIGYHKRLRNKHFLPRTP